MHFLNPVPIRLIHDRWIDKYTERHVSALANLKANLEAREMTKATTSETTQIYRVYIKATPEAIWEAITKPEWTVQYGYAPLVEYELRSGGAFRAHANEGHEGGGLPGRHQRR